MVSGLVERIGEEMGSLTSKTFPGTDKEVKTVLEQPIPTHGVGLEMSIRSHLQGRQRRLRHERDQTW